MSKFKKGDKVHLKTGRQERTVEHVGDLGVLCITELKDGTIVRDTFEPETLNHVPPPPTTAELEEMLRKF
ncbi:hypothetical protein AA106555_1795 [Neokomagataea thailandica NBRC 106555]|uniref:DUF2158 domain-containing protein n=1 Tax=Neokomagataea thailandica NBRC 106555 TaxID=1223520 RepID=A0ABQ0QS18_9PROT|nr:hypothetical protein [Neokomagataea thailandica]GBR54727.1 hypothetical protein AA106555_1795 [Neokomagataea thailandica NBRC 106555]